MKPVVLLLGKGSLFAHVCRLLTDCCHVVCQERIPAPQECRQGEPKPVPSSLPSQADLALVLHDAWHPREHDEAERVFRKAGIPWLRGFIRLGEGIVGPLVQPDRPGCSHCADRRRTLAGQDRVATWQLREFLQRDAGIPRDPYASEFLISHLAQLVAVEALRVLRGQESHLLGRLQLINGKSLASTRHLFLPDPQCPVCGSLPDDTPEAATLTLQPRPKRSPTDDRTRSVEEFKQPLLRDYLDSETGLLTQEGRNFLAPFAISTVTMPLWYGNEISSGRTLSFADSKLTAILEGLERYGGYNPRGKRTVVRDTYRRLQQQALDPATVGLHDPKRSRQPGFPFAPCHPDRPLNWVWGYSLGQQRPLLVPERLAYYSLGGEADAFVFETSNGCALGGSVEEAILHGLFEVVERDAFLLTWYAKLPLPRLELASIPDPQVQVMAAYLHLVTGYDLHLFNATTENGIPSLIAVAQNRTDRGPHLLCASSAHLDPLQAITSATLEVASLIRGLEPTYEANRERALRMLHNSSLVQGMEDHVLLYSLPEAASRFDFLLDRRREGRLFTEEFPTRQQERQADLTAELQALLRVFKRLQLDVIAVEQTTPEMRRIGLHAVKVLVPGMLPMTFGHHLVRLEGLERVLRVPMELGYAERPLTRRQLNRDPHPFP
ncbi:MAG TPA: TOMM precursor leader peptide-binding protein [Bacilli bacterium]|nr:TOMM precursor leader peptide-binding protein [Bacilli bacterium]